MSKHTEKLQRLGEFSLNQWLGLGIALGGPEQVENLLRCKKVTVTFDTAEEHATITAEVPVQKFLCRAGTVSLPERPESFNPREFFQARQGLWVSDWFRERILAGTETVETVPVLEIAMLDLVKDANDTEIRQELPNDHVFEDVGEFCADLAGMIERQADGQDGDLLNNGYANIFYVRSRTGEVFVVYAYWRADSREWRVYASPLYVSRWGAGNRVFSRNSYSFYPLSSGSGSFC